MRIRKHEHVLKGTPIYIPPLLVQEKIGPSLFLLSDGRKWNGLRLTKFPKQTDEALLNQSIQRSNQIGNKFTDVPRKSGRSVKPPVWMEDL